MEDVATVREKESMISLEDLEKVNINTATAEELMALPRVGPRTARSIILYRETHGYFRKPEEIVRVRGIGPMAYDFYLKERITVGGEVAALPEKTLPAARPAITCRRFMNAALGVTSRCVNVFFQRWAMGDLSLLSLVSS